MIRTFLIKNLLATSKKNKQRLKFFSELGIFLVLAALISSGISIYFENKLNNYKVKLIKLELEEFKIQEWLTDAPSRNLEFKIGKFTYDTIENNEKVNISKKRFYFYLLTWYPFTIRYAIDDIELIKNEILKKKYNFKNIKKTNEDALNYVYEIYDKFPDNENEYLESSEILEIEEVLKNVPFDDILFHLNQSEYNTLQINLFFQDYNRIVDSEKKELKKIILNTTDKSTDAILYAFIFQLVIFSLVQIFELKELS
ncbi:hypothetical protein [Candidatus Pelagibacter sp.]|uniref:hypothetical protein n=1 Tax=Candidatus Pelagibacter sp. TaxID=2024849 RepID=UPI003F84FF03